MICGVASETDVLISVFKKDHYVFYSNSDNLHQFVCAFHLWIMWLYRHIAHFIIQHIIWLTQSLIFAIKRIVLSAGRDADEIKNSLGKITQVYVIPAHGFANTRGTVEKQADMRKIEVYRSL